MLCTVWVSEQIKYLVRMRHGVTPGVIAERCGVGGHEMSEHSLAEVTGPLLQATRGVIQASVICEVGSAMVGDSWPMAPVWRPLGGRRKVAHLMVRAV